ncbi:DUF3164 family protein [Geobacter sp.]|uniref:DUF3164 family protein n=1 Tax=Geobacter sp. TaxID=46610 RepID=UPI0026233422|nr:DUF3164 family protein [Geobacter sp.]
MHEQATTTPAGYMQNAQGHLVPFEVIKPIDLERDRLVREIVVAAQELSEALTRFKAGAMGDIEAFVKLSAEQYETRYGGNKGNVSLVSFDGEYKVLRAINEFITFDERLQVARELIGECIHAWAEGSRAEIRTLINDAFSVDRQGRINTARILALRRLDIQDERWQTAMQAIGEAIQISGSKAYIRVYKRQSDGSYRQINLDLAAL